MHMLEFARNNDMCFFARSSHYQMSTTQREETSRPWTSTATLLWAQHCSVCDKWLHKNCSFIQTPLDEDVIHVQKIFENLWK